MKYSTRLSDAAHVLALVAMSADEPLTSDAIATSIRTNPAFVRQLMSAMRRAGLVSSVRGHPRPSLARPASDISLFDIYRAVEGDKPLLHQDTHTNPECGVGVNTVCPAGMLRHSAGAGGRGHAGNKPAGHSRSLPCENCVQGEGLIARVF